MAAKYDEVISRCDFETRVKSVAPVLSKGRQNNPIRNVPMAKARINLERDDEAGLSLEELRELRAKKESNFKTDL